MRLIQFRLSLLLISFAVGMLALLLLRLSPGLFFFFEIILLSSTNIIAIFVRYHDSKWGIASLLFYNMLMGTILFIIFAGLFLEEKESVINVMIDILPIFAIGLPIVQTVFIHEQWDIEKSD